MLLLLQVIKTVIMKRALMYIL